MAMVVDEAGSQGFPRQTLAVLRGTDFHDPSVLERYADAAPCPISIENQIRDQRAPHDVRRESTRPGGKPLPAPPETLFIQHRHLDAQAPGRLQGRLVSRVGVAYDAYARVVEEHALEAGCAVFCAVG